jgi:hypothetical protein
MAWLALTRNPSNDRIFAADNLSVWVAASVAWVDPWIISEQFWINYAVTLFVLHRLSNVLHELMEKWLSRRPLTLAIHKTEAVLLPDLGENDESGSEQERSE